jgi:two-component system, chemotaxis family, chemotaxis protein CheY
MKVIVVDDSLVIRTMLKKLLVKLGCEVALAENGLIALNKIKEVRNFDLALVDWNMPVMNGIELLVEVKNDPAFKEMKLMMVTTETEPRQLIRALEAGADEYVMKPFTSEVIAEKIRLLGFNV